MLKNELKIFFPPNEFFSNQKVKGFAELKIPEPLEISKYLIFIFFSWCRIYCNRK
jgi:hypothetical protein